jgi:hypothetical protein
LNDGHGSFRLVNSDDYPSETQSPLSWGMSLPPAGFLSPCLSWRSRSECLAFVSQPIPASDHSTRQHLWALALSSVSKPRAPNPSRGPPSLFSL